MIIRLSFFHHTDNSRKQNHEYCPKKGPNNCSPFSFTVHFVRHNLNSPLFFIIYLFYITYCFCQGDASQKTGRFQFADFFSSFLINTFLKIKNAPTEVSAQKHKLRLSPNKQDKTRYRK
jgi:hypothetical protein